jgi:antitoxin HicB
MYFMRYSVETEKSSGFILRDGERERTREQLADRTRDLRSSQRPAGAPSWLREEEPEDPKVGSKSRAATSEGDHSMSNKGRVGSSFEDFLKEEGVLEETNAIAVKRVLAWQLEQAMERGQISKRAMAKAMKTSRSQLDRILDPNNDRIRLDTLTAAAHVLGLSLRIELVL